MLWTLDDVNYLSVDRRKSIRQLTKRGFSTQDKFCELDAVDAPAVFRCQR